LRTGTATYSFAGGQAGSALKTVAPYFFMNASRSGSGSRMPTTPYLEMIEYMLPLTAVYAEPKFDLTSTPSTESSNRW